MSEDALFRPLQSPGQTTEDAGEPERIGAKDSSPPSLADALARVTDPEVRRHLEALLKELGHLR